MLGVLGMALASGSGCVQVTHVLTLQADGSGLLDMHVAAPEEAVRTWGRILAGEAPGDAAADASPGPVRLFDAAAVREDFDRYRGLGLRVLHAEETQEDGWRHFRLLVRFEDMSALNETSFYAYRTWSLRRTPEGDYVLKQMPVPSGRMTPAEGLNLSDPAADASLKRQLEAFRARFTIRVPGDILRANADLWERRSATWTYAAASDGGGLTQLQSSVQQVVFAGQGLSLSPFGRQHMRLSVERP